MAAALEIVCPAGELISEAPGGGPACRCRIEHSTLNAHKEPTSLVEFCAGDYTKCPSWRADRKRLDEHKKPLVMAE